MGTNAKIVEGGGWVVTQTVGRPKLRIFLWLSLIWLFVSLGASACFGDAWPRTSSGWDWLALLCILPEPVFVALAVWFWFAEQSRVVTELEPNPNYDPRNLY
jgi:hypothetical protein